MKKLRKFLVASVMTLSVIAMSGFMALAPMGVSAAASAGDLIKMDGLSSVYYLGDDGKRYVFPNESTYFSWYSDFSGVVTIPAAELQSYPLGGNVTMRPGTTLVKITTDPSVYAVEPNGVLRKIANESQAAALYGTNWNKRIVDLADAFFTNYTIGQPLADGEVPVGSLVKNADSASVYYYDGTNYRSIASEAAMTANRFRFENVMTIANDITAGGTAITGMEAGLVKTSQNHTTTNPITTSGVMVSVSANTAPASSVVAGQALAEIGSFNFTASNDGNAVIKGLKLKRIGISADTTLSNIYLYDGVTRLTDGATFSNGMVSFASTNLMEIPAGQTKTITVKADVATSATGNVGVSIDSASDVTSSAATVTGSFPLNSNLMSPTSATLATVALTNTLTAGPYSAKAGNSNVVVWSETVNVGYKAVDFKYIAFKQIGSINADDLENLSLYVDGTKVGTASLINNDVAFNLDNPVRLNTGNHTIEMKADIVKGSSRTFSFSLQVAANAVFTDTNYSVNVIPTGDTAISAAPSFTISTGSLSVSADTTFNTTEIVKTASNAVLSRFKVKAYGEDVKINTLGVNLTLTGTGSSTSTESINDLSVVVDGNQVGSSQSWSIGTSTNATTTKTFGTNNLFTIAAGDEVIVEIKGSLSLDSNTAITAVKADLGAMTAQGATSYTGITSTAVSANNTLTIVTGSLTTAKNSAVQNQNVSKNTQKVKIGSFILSTGSAEGVNVSNLRVALTVTATSSTAMDQITNLYINENTTPINPQATNDFNVNFNIAKNSNKVIDVYADLGDLADATTIVTKLTATYKTDVTMTFGTGTETTGQTLTLATATLADPTLVTNDPVSMLIAGGQTTEAANYKFVATNGNATINELTFTVNSVSDSISSLTVDGKTAAVVGSSVTLTGLNKEVIAGLQGTNIEVLASYIPVTSSGQGGVGTYATSSLTLTTVKYTVNGVQSTKTGLSVSSNAMVVVASYPTVTLAEGNPVGMSSGYLANAESELLRFKVANSNSSNPINLKTITVTPTYSGTLASTTAQKIKVYDASDLNTVLGEASVGTSGTAAKITFTADSVITSEKTYVVKVNTTGLTADGNSIMLSLTSSDTYTGLGTATAGDWAWNDSTVSNYANGYLVKNLPLNGNTMVK